MMKEIRKLYPTIRVKGVTWVRIGIIKSYELQKKGRTVTRPAAVRYTVYDTNKYDAAKCRRLRAEKGVGRNPWRHM